MKEAAAGLPFPHSKVEKDYSGEVAQGPHRHPASSRHFVFRLFLWGLHEGREATLWLHRVTSDLRPLDVQEDTPGGISHCPGGDLPQHPQNSYWG